MSDTEVVPVETPVIPPVEVVEPPPEPTPEPVPPKPQMVPVAVVAGLRGKARELENELAQARRETQEARALAERLTAQQKPEDKEPPRYIPPAPTDEAEIERKAEYLVFKREVGQVQQRGMEKYGSSFNDTIRALAAVGADNDAFVSQVLAVDSSKAHELLNSLAQDLEKTATLVSMDPNRRIVELTRMATATPKVETKVAEEPKVPPKVVSKAPPPAPIVEPTTHKEIDWRSDEASDEEFDKGYWEKYEEAQREAIMTLDDYNKTVMRPTVLRGIRNGKFDNILGQILKEHAESGHKLFDQEIIQAMLDRALIVCTKQPNIIWDNPDIKVGATLRIKLPSDFFAKQI